MVVKHVHCCCFVFYTMIQIDIHSTVLDERISSDNCFCEHIKVAAFASHIVFSFLSFFFW